MKRISVFTQILMMSISIVWGQSSTPTPIPPNAIVTNAGGIEITFVPGSNPTLTARSTSGDTAPGLAMAGVRTVRFVDKKGQDVDPASIKPTERLQPIGDGSGPGGLLLQKIVVDRD